MIALIVGFVVLIALLFVTTLVMISIVMAVDWLERKKTGLGFILLFFSLLSVPAYLFGGYLLERFSK